MNGRVAHKPVPIRSLVTLLKEQETASALTQLLRSGVKIVKVTLMMLSSAIRIFLVVSFVLSISSIMSNHFEILDFIYQMKP